MRANEFKLPDGMKVFVDMDGVLADLFNHVGGLHDVEHYAHMTKDQWETFFKDSNAYELFRDLPAFPTANKLLQMVVTYGGGYNILSSPLNFDREGSIRGKREWLQKHIHIPADGVVFEHDKYKYAVNPDGTPNVLIDDYGVNIRAWQQAGGIAIKYQADEDSLSKVFAGLKDAARGTQESIEEDYHPHQKKVEHFIDWVYKKLNLHDPLPEIVFSNNEKLARSKHRTGYFNKEKNIIYVYTGHRNLVDIFRTLAHEMTHEKQGEEGRLKDKKSPPGSPNERDADSSAGYLMKLYTKEHPDVINGTLDESRMRPTGNDSPQAWIDYFLTSDHPNLKGQDPETLKRMALAARSKAVHNPPKPKPTFRPSKPNPNVRYWWQEKDEDIEEGWKDWVAGAGAAAMLAGGGGAAYDAYKAHQKEPEAVVAKAPSDFSKGVQKIAKDAVPKHLVTGSPHEKFLTQAAVAAGITGEELAQFLGQTAHETGNYKHMGEIGGSLDFKKYEPVFKKDKKKKFIMDPKTGKPKNFNPKAVTLGNDMPGDGVKYHGRGYIQLTGKYNYTQAGKALGLDLVKHPELVEKPEVAAKVAVWFWQNRVQPKVTDYSDTASATKPINKGLKHLDQRKDKFNKFTTAMR